MSAKQRVIFAGKIIRLTLDTVLLPNGNTAELEIVHHTGGAAVIAVDTENCVCLLRQYRHAAGGWLWELPAGKLDNAEAPLLCAQRELEEEAGMRAQDWQSLGKIVSSPGVFTEVVHLYLARVLSAMPTRMEEQEVIEIHWLPWGEALRMARAGEIEDAKTLAGLLRAYELVAK